MLGGWDEEEVRKVSFLLFFWCQVLDSSRNVSLHGGGGMVWGRTVVLNLGCTC